MTPAIDARRLVRIATVLSCIVAGSCVYFALGPYVESASQRVDGAELQLDSDRTTAFNVRALAEERGVLVRRYARLFAQNPEAVFIRGLASDAARHGVTLLSTSESKSDSPTTIPNTSTSGPSLVPGDAAMSIGAERTAISVSLRGRYRNLLATIGEMSLGPEIVRVDPPTLTRDRSEVTAIVPVTIFEPGMPAATAGATP